tara:strand:- start:5958 stop:6374 length:417 start_codon:yes stop_codon:yes gene_type:complete
MSGRPAAVVAGVMAALLIGNGLAMLIAPEPWYWTVPGVAERGPFNHHFVRDIGMAYLLVGGCFAAGIALPGQRLALWAVPTAWLAGHALFHVWEVAGGHMPPGALLEDFAGVMLPTLIGLALCVGARRSGGSSAAGPV